VIPPGPPDCLLSPPLQSQVLPGRSACGGADCIISRALTPPIRTPTRTPIPGPTPTPTPTPSDKYYKAAKIADALSKDVHYTVDEKQRSVLLTEDG
jgi:hypothetical protein